MGLNCTRCEGTGFLNIEQVPENIIKEHEETGLFIVIEKWIASNDDHDACICDCCGDTHGWHGIPGEHYNSDGQQGDRGPYAYNGGLCECH